MLFRTQSAAVYGIDADLVDMSGKNLISASLFYDMDFLAWLRFAGSMVITLLKSTPNYFQIWFGQP